MTAPSGRSGDGCSFCRDHALVFLAMRGLCRISRGGTEMIANWIGGVVAVVLIIYLFVALVRPDKF
jgi:K+-transporting ATPase KdpF subunit